MLKSIFGKHARFSVKVLRTTLASLALVCLMPFAARYLPGEPLDESEKDLTHSIFNSSVDKQNIKIHKSSIANFYMELIGADALTFGDTILLRNEIYNNRELDNDFYTHYVMAHELTHVWQGQNCGNLHVRALAEKTSSIFNGNGLYGHYGYILSSDKDLSEYGIEQQASIIADYYALQQGIEPLYLINKENKDEYTNLYESTLSNFLKNPSYLKNQCK